MIIRHNGAALRAYNSNRQTTTKLQKNLEKLSSGYRINRAGDDAAGLSVSERLRLNVTETGRCQTNAQEGLDLAKTADGALQEVNDMLKRARSLCVQAANGTYSDQELKALSEEMNQIFAEIDRIGEGTYHNSIALFRGEVSSDTHFEYDESFNTLGPGKLEEWGEMDFIKSEKFDPPQMPKAATATIKLDSGIDFNDVTSLVGRSITVGTSSTTSCTFYFTDGTVQAPTGGRSTQGINVKDKTTKQALESLCNYMTNSRYYPYSSEVASAVLDPDAKTITLTAFTKTKDEGTITVDDRTIPNAVSGGDGAWANGTTIAVNPSGSSSIGQVDGEGATNNQPVYPSTATATFSLASMPATLSAKDVSNLNGNYLSVAGQKLYFNTLSPVPSAGMTRDSFGTSLAAGINAITNYTATYDAASKSINVTLTNQPTNTGYTGGIYEYTTSATTHDAVSKTWTSNKLNMSVNVTKQPSPEQPEVCEITVPSTSSPFSLYIGGTRYLYHDSGTHPLKQTDDSGTKYDGSTSSLNRPVTVDIKGMSRDQIVNDLASRICGISGGTVSVSDSKITVTAGTLNNSMNLKQNLQGTEIKVESYKTVVDSPGTDSVLNSSALFTKNTTVSFALGSSFKADDLAGKGFTVTSANLTTRKIEFVNGAGAGLSDKYTDVDISGCNNFDDLKTVVQNAMGSDYTVNISGSPATLTISMDASHDVTVTDGSTGVGGLAAGGEIKFSGGQDVTHSQTTIDFSSINQDNLEDLLGKGFRITCATCPGEYINVFFCWTDDGSAPRTFPNPDPTAPDDPAKTRTIHNCPVELSKVTSPDLIVQSIVEQVKPTLKHFTDIEIGPGGTSLIARDKRLGLPNNSNNPNASPETWDLPEVLSGVYANFTYAVDKVEVEDLPEDGSVVMKDSKVDIYVGSEPYHQLIPIHLPYIDLTALRLDPPEYVDFTESDPGPDGWLDRVDQADIAISKYRGTIGADYNRLERAIQALGSTNEQLTSALSVVRDADMAEIMTEQVRDQILVQTQQAMMAQANQVPQGVLSLMQ